MRILRAGLAAALLAAAPPAQAHEVDREVLAKLASWLYTEIMLLHLSTVYGGGQAHECALAAIAPHRESIADRMFPEFMGDAAPDAAPAAGAVWELTSHCYTQPPQTPDRTLDLQMALIELDGLISALAGFDYGVDECARAAIGPGRMALAEKPAAGGAAADAAIAEIQDLVAQCYGSR